MVATHNILWMCAESAIAIFAALRAHSVALLGFGADSGIELASAFVVFLRFKKHTYIKEAVAARITGVLLFALAAFIVVSSIAALMNPRFRPEPTYLGIALLIAAAIGMPWLALQKRLLATRVESGSLKADATQSSLCAYLAWIALAGLLFDRQSCGLVLRKTYSLLNSSKLVIKFHFGKIVSTLKFCILILNFYIWIE